MGFVRQRPILVLDFEGTELDGLTVRAERCSIADYIAIGNAIQRPTSSLDDFGRDIAELQELVIPRLIEWDLEEEDGTPIPLTAEYIVQQDKQFQLDLFNAYRYGNVLVPRPLGKPSDSGEPSPEESIPMDVLSESLPS
ncbi:hypothetical protein [Lentzea sp. NPDC092896]|uniref:hypothetical protein n=1 Tax=Lentzea sp. NPDC092896 TaxID=3364127 RepID=UPI00382E1598